VHSKRESVENSPLRWTAWNNGQHDKSGNGYGLKIPIADRDKYFDRTRGSVKVVVSDSGAEIEVNTNKKSFWSDSCRELISKELGVWLIRRGLAPWPKGSPPQVKVTPLAEGHFRIEFR
jgi:hypothetical protein